MVYYLTVHIGQDIGTIHIDSLNDDVPDTLIFTGSKNKAHALITLLNNGKR